MRVRPTDLWQVGPKSVDDGFYAGPRPAFGSQTILCCMENHGRPLAPEIMNIFNGRPRFDHAALCCKESLNKNFYKKINPKKIFFFLVKFS